MPSIRIPIVNMRQGNPIRFYDHDGRVCALPQLRLRVSIFVGQFDPAIESSVPELLPAILDTGAPVTIVPKRTWQVFAPQIQRLALVEPRLLSGASGGRRYDYFLGRVWMGAVDLWGRMLPPVSVLAQFREDDVPDDAPQPPTLLGLWGGILEGRSLTRWPATERFDPDIPTLESFGQWWHLADP